MGCDVESDIARAFRRIGMKLHLGCGETYLEGYQNIDYLPSKHTVQTKGRADEYADIRELAYAPASVEEIRLHHVFEHFTRPVALALLTAWNAWLEPGGTLRIEVPDFDRTARRVLWPLTSAAFWFDNCLRSL